MTGHRILPHDRIQTPKAQLLFLLAAPHPQQRHPQTPTHNPTEKSWGNGRASPYKGNKGTGRERGEDRGWWRISTQCVEIGRPELVGGKASKAGAQPAHSPQLRGLWRQRTTASLFLSFARSHSLSPSQTRGHTAPGCFTSSLPNLPCRTHLLLGLWKHPTFTFQKRWNYIAAFHSVLAAMTHFPSKAKEKNMSLTDHASLSWTARGFSFILAWNGNMAHLKSVPLLWLLHQANSWPHTTTHQTLS